jgi:hypothetical protein
MDAVVTPVSGVVITPEMAKNIANATETKQLEMATNLLKTLKNEFSMEDIGVLDVLDALGICGLSLTIGEWASYTYLTQLQKAV